MSKTIVMKDSIYILLLLLGLSSCSLDTDTVDEPKCTLIGRLMDAETGEPFQPKITSTTGIIRLYEVNPRYPNPSPYTMILLSGGEFKDTRLFESTYKLIPYSIPAILGDTVYTNVKKGVVNRVTLSCIPYLRISARVENDVLYFSFSKSSYVSYGGDIKDIRVMYHTSAMVNDTNTTADEGSLIGVALTDVGGPSQANALGKEFSFALNRFVNGEKTLKIEPGEYYFRVAARITGATPEGLNYSPIVKGVYVGEPEI